MNQQEQQMIAALAERIRTAPAPQVDRDADDFIRRTIGSLPNALYILTQTVLLQEMALNQAKAQIQELEQGRQAPQQGFLPGQQPQSGYSQSAYAQPAYEAPPPRSGFSDFLHNAAQTAAGVVAGEVAFGALSSIFGGHRGGGFFEGGGIVPGGETIVNNYYGDQERGGFDRGDGGDSRFAQAADDSDQDISSDIEDDRDDSGDDFSDGDDFSGGDDSN